MHIVVVKCSPGSSISLVINKEFPWEKISLFQITGIHLGSCQMNEMVIIVDKNIYDQKEVRLRVLKIGFLAGILFSIVDFFSNNSSFILNPWEEGWSGRERGSMELGRK